MDIRVLHVVRNPIVVKLFLKPIIAAEVKRGHRVELACGPGVSPPADIAVPVHFYPIRRSLSPMMLIPSIRRLSKIIREGDFDLIVAHMVLGGLAGRLAFALASRPGRLIYASHGLPCYPTRPRFKYSVALGYEVFMSRWTDALIVLNRHDYELARTYKLARNGGPVFLLRSVGIENKAIADRQSKLDPAAYRRRLGLKPGPPLICYLGRFIAAKGIKLYLEIARRYLESGRETYFVIAGYGPLEGYVRRYIRRHNLGDRVRLVGWHEDSIGLLLASDLLLFPTLYEGSPVVIQEAMSCGTAVLSSKIPGPEDLVENGITGALVSPGDVEGFVEQLVLLMDNPSRRRRMEAAGRKAVRDFDVSQCVAPWIEAIESAASYGKRAPEQSEKQ